MGFLSYCQDYYRTELQKLESAPPTCGSLYHARQLLQMLDDLADEGYTELNETLEAMSCGIARLRAYLRNNGSMPFPLPQKNLVAGNLSYSPEDMELTAAIASAMQAAAAVSPTVPVPFTGRLRHFCSWLGYEAQTAYIFLLRDTLLPYAFYSAQGRERIYPWLLSRSSFAALTGRQNADDEIRASVYRALEAGCRDYPSFLRYALPDIRRTMERYPQVSAVLRSMLGDIAAERILVVESGCAGTFPLLLMSLDDRVEPRMYTTYPYLTDIYQSRIFTSRYEENRTFETLASQALFYRFSRLENGRFYVQRCTNAEIKRQSLEEIQHMLSTMEEPNHVEN